MVHVVKSRRVGPFAALLTLLSALVPVAGCGAVGPSSGRGGVTITDVLGRHVKLRTSSPRILLGGSRLLYTTALLNKHHPTEHIAGWPDDLQKNDPDTYQRYLKQFPEISKVPKIGQLPDGSLSAEKAIDLHPDVFVVSAANFKAAKDAGTIDKLKRAGIPTVVVDYFVDPLHHTAPSVRIMGRLLGREAQAKNYVSYYESAMHKVRSRIRSAHRPATPTFLWRAPGYYDCCSTFARSNLASLIRYAGGSNTADHVLSTQQGTMSPEKVLDRDPSVVIATGADWAPGTPAKKGGFVPLGYNESSKHAKSQLKSVVDGQAGFRNLKAVKNHRVYAAWHHFYDSPYNFLAVEWFAKWMHPGLFKDIDPDKSVRDLHRKFLPVAPGGAFWAELP